MPSGGSRKGKVGASYSNRTDLNVKKLPVTAVPGQPYGQAGAQQAAQQTVPMAPAPVPDIAAPAPGPAPGELPGLTSPSTRPSEPITHGLPIGAGAGPEVLPQAGAAGTFATTRDLLVALAQQHDSPALRTIAMYAQDQL